MTYTQFVSTMNHLYMSKGPKYLVDSVDYWFNLEYTGYCIGLLEYSCNVLGISIPSKYVQYTSYVEKDYVLTESMEIMCETMGESYLHNYIERSMPEFIRHKVCITEVGNAV